MRLALRLCHVKRLTVLFQGAQALEALPAGLTGHAVLRGGLVGGQLARRGEAEAASGAGVAQS